jgi:hypothetical protein
MRSEHDDDPEKRIAELERRQGRASAGLPQPPAYPPAPQPGWQQAPNPYPAQPQPGWGQAPGWPQQQSQADQPPVGQWEYGSLPDYSAGLPAKYRPIQSGRSSHGKGWIVFVVALPLALVLLFAAGVVGYRVYEYPDGTPTTAKVDYCFDTGSKRSRSHKCLGTWTIDGRETYGQIRGADYDDVGSTVDVRVHDGKATTPRAVRKDSVFAAGCTVVAIALIVASLTGFLVIRKRRRLK